MHCALLPGKIRGLLTLAVISRRGYPEMVTRVPQVAELGALLRDGLLSGEVCPLPSHIFGTNDVPAAFCLLASGVSNQWPLHSLALRHA